MAFPWSSVEAVGDGVAVLLRQSSHALSFRDVLAYQAVGVFVGAALP